MRILVANDGLGDAGGVQVYLETVAAALAARGHAIGIAHCSDSHRAAAWTQLGALPRFRFGRGDRENAFKAVAGWNPDVCYTNNMADLRIERALLTVAPVVKFMHGYFGTCVSGLKTFGFPARVPCDRAYGPACLALYLPRRCGRLSPLQLVNGWRWAEEQRELFGRYAAMIVASEHMRDEYVASGVRADHVLVNPLFSTHQFDPIGRPQDGPPRVLFLGRMTSLKGGDLLIRAADHLARRRRRSPMLTLIGEGPQRREWEKLAARLGVAAHFTGWVDGDARWALVGQATVLAVPSVWPEPFGLVGLEAGSLGIPTVAVDAGGIRQWLRDGVNGVLVPRPVTPARLGDALAALLDDPERLAALGQGARRVAAELTVERHVHRLEAILRRAVDERPSVC